MIKKALVVNDDDIFLLIASKMLNKAQFTDEILTATNGEKALAYFSEIVSMGETCYDKAPEFVFLDLNMPVMNGWDFLEVFSSKYAHLFPETKVVIVSSTTDNNDLVQLEKYRMVSDFMCVPMTLQKLDGIKERYSISHQAGSLTQNHHLQVN